MDPVPENPVPEIIIKTRKRLTIAQKLDIADLLDNGHCAAAIKRQFGIAERTVRNIEATAPALLCVANINTTENQRAGRR